MAQEEEDVTEGRGSARRSPPRLNSPDQSWLRYRRESSEADGDVIKDLAEGTGGTFFHHNNDLRAGFERLVAAPAFSYVLGFSPTEPKQDGQFHRLKVRLAALKHVTLESRRGYYAIEFDAKADSAGEVSDAISSEDQRFDLPIVLQTGYSKPFASDNAKVLIVAKVDLTWFRYQNMPPLNRDALTAIAILFDSKGGA